MKRRLIEFLILIFFICSKSYADEYCNLLIEKIDSNFDYTFSELPINGGSNDFGFYIQQDWNVEEQQWEFRKAGNENFVVGKIITSDTAADLKTGDLILKMNDKKFTFDDEQQDEYNSLDKIKFEFFNSKKGNFTLNLEATDHYFNELWFDMGQMAVNAIDIKNGNFDVYFSANIGVWIKRENDIAMRLNTEKFYDLIAEAMVRKTDEDGAATDDTNDWGWSVCNFSEEEYKKIKIFDPGGDVKILNISKADNDLRQVYYKVTPYMKEVNPGIGDAVVFEKKISQNLKIKNYFNLRTFPFDKQTIELKFVDKGFLLRDRLFIISDLLTETVEDFVKKNDINGWNITDHTIDYFQHTDTLMQEGQYSSGLNIAITIERKTGYYIFKVIFPIVLILMICWSVVWIHPRELESRLTITIVCLLSLIAYNFVIDKELPKLEYLTVLDWVILISYLYAAIPNFLTIASFKFLQTNEPLSMKLESYGKRYGPTSYVGIIIFIVFLNANFNPENASTMISWMAGR